MFDRADIPAMPVRTLEELMDDPHLRQIGFFTEREHPSEGPIVTTASPLDFEKTKTRFRRHAPRIGYDRRPGGARARRRRSVAPRGGRAPAAVHHP